MTISVNKVKVPWIRILGESLLIVVSVYVAIVLQDLSDKKTKRKEAYGVLNQMLSEMKSDQMILQEVIDEQRMLNVQYSNVDRWLSNTSVKTLPFDSLGSALGIITITNRTHYPQDAAWRTMVASGELNYLNAPILVTKLGELFETRNDRIAYNGREYDRNLNNTISRNINEMWNPFSNRFFDQSPKAILKLKTHLSLLKITWNEYYIELMLAYQMELKDRADDIEEYLASKS